MAICNTCGANIPDNMKFCTACGAACASAPSAPAPVSPPPAEPAPAYQQPAPLPQTPVYAPPPSDLPPAKGSIYAPIGMLGFIGYSLLFAIPIVGQVLCIMWAFGKKGNVNRRGFARATLVFLILGLIAGITAGIIVGVAAKNAGDAAGGEKGIVAWFQGIVGNEDDAEPDDNDNTQADADNTRTQPTEAPGETEPIETTQAPGSTLYDFGDIFTADWPDNEFTRQVPKPDFEISFGSTTDTEYSALIKEATLEQIQAYAKILQKVGFNKNAETSDEDMLGVSYTYKADNGKGYEVEISYVSLMNLKVIAIRKI